MKATLRGARRGMRIEAMNAQGGRRNSFRMTEKGKAPYGRNKRNWAYAKRVLKNLL